MVPTTTTTAFRISLHMEEIVMRRLILSNIALNIAQNLGVDYHAAMEELYCYMRKKDIQTHKELIQSIRSLLPNQTCHFI